MFTYRPELDGLRAVAVLSVVFFHAGIGLFSGGFVGVDIFFVLSGFLITSITMQEMEQGKFSFGAFYERRVRRLFPPLVPVLAFTWLASAALLGEREFVDAARSFAATLALAANWYFYSAVGYFDGPGELTPLLHMWSLSIEEQFYLIFPFIVYALFRLGVRPLYLCLALLVLSFCYSVYLLGIGDNELLFYGSFGRFWELLVGACLALYKPSKVKSRGVNDLLEIVGAGLICWSVLTYDSGMLFPGPSALAPTLGTALIIFAGGRGRIISPALKIKPIIWVGLISYGLYLWHWPIFVFVRHLDPLANGTTMLVASLLALGLSIMSYHWLEQPIRKKIWLAGRKEIYIFGVGGVSAFIIVIALSFMPAVNAAQEKFNTAIRNSIYNINTSKALASLGIQKKRYHAELNLNFHGGLPDFDLEMYRGYTCSFDGGNSQSRVLGCLVAQAKNHNVLLIGDSIGRDTYHALRRAYPAVNFIMMHHSGCPPVERRHSETIACFPDLAGALSQLSSKVKISGIILNFRYRPKDWRTVTKSIPLMRRITDNIVMLGVTPMFSLSVEKFIKSLPAGSPVPLVVEKGNIQMVPWSFDDLAQQASVIAREQGIEFADVSSFFCDAESCRLWVDNSYDRPLFWDNQHLTVDAIEQYGQFLLEMPAIDLAIKRSQGS